MKRGIRIASGGLWEAVGLSPEHVPDFQRIRPF